MAGQEKLKNAKVLVIGAGGLGSPCLLYLAAAGIGTLGVIDADVVDESNLQRQVVHSTQTLGMAKVLSAKQQLTALNPTIQIDTYEEFLSIDNVLSIFAQYDLIIDGCDSLAVRYLINDACVQLGKPFVYGSIYRFDGQVALLNANGGPCYRCLYSEPPESIPSCSEAGVLGVLPGLIGVSQATEAIKWIAGIGEPLAGKLLTLDALSNDYFTLNIEKNSECAACGSGTLNRLGDVPDISCEVASPSSQQVNEISPTDAAKWLGTNDIQLVDVRHDYEVAYSALAQSQHLPLTEILAGKRDQELQQLGEKNTVFYCLGGVRSQQALNYAQEKFPEQFAQAKSLKGGIRQWAKDVEPLDYFQ